MSKDPKQLSLLDEYTQADNGPVVCLGMTFENEEARREYFCNELRKKLPELKQIEGFPIGEDEDIIALSDPPYYTACPNPWLNDFIEEWEKEKVEKYGRYINEEYHREPFAADVSEGKTNQIYRSHGYHTKVPHKAIMRYILHYTKPGDIILDGFCGTGMTGVAAQLCADKNEISGLGLNITNNTIYDEEGNQISDVGERKVILSDLSPAASFIASNFNTPINESRLKKEFEKVFNELKEKVEWMYEKETETTKEKICYSVWSDVYLCSSCSEEIVFWDIAVEPETQKMNKILHCPNCNSELNKRNLERAWETVYDNSIKSVTNKAKQILVSNNIQNGKNRFDSNTDELDLNLIKKIENSELLSGYPTDELPEGYNTQQPKNSHGVTNVHHFYTKRSLIVLSTFYNLIKDSRLKNQLLMMLTGVAFATTKLYRWTPNYEGGGPLSGTLYIPALYREINALDALGRFGNKLPKSLSFNKKHNNFNISVNSATKLPLNENSIDYIFIDPPFGANIMYSELNFLWESWLKVKTNSKKEAIMNDKQQKGIDEYKALMLESFANFYKVLKPGKWITIEFSNSQASVWNSIQETLQKSGFIIANVSALDKKQGSFKAITSTTAVKQDLVITAYKPRKENIEKMKQEQNTEESAWTFVSQHLEQLPVFIGVKGEAQIISERTPRILFDRMVAYHVQNGLPVPISSAEFQTGVAQRFPMRDGMAFLENQVAEYDKKRTLVKEFAQMSLFVSDENSAIEWIRQQLLKKPQTRQDIHPNYMKEIQHIAKHELLPELDDLLHQNFLRYDGEGNVPDQIITYLRRTFKELRGLEPNDHAVIDKAINRWYVPDPNKQADLEKLREKALLREFDGYLIELEKSKKKLKQFRTEAIRAGFKKAYSEKDFERIVTVGERLPESIIQEDDKLLMYYDNACIRLGL
ncbi:DNA methyltransferase [Peribacillus frigoritolerans]|uniref:DNA methyltransferase n=1 Tax=Peribacillus frigoritolerans TaxID=450367 RepID=UPI003D28E868